VPKLQLRRKVKQMAASDQEGDGPTAGVDPSAVRDAAARLRLPAGRETQVPIEVPTPTPGEGTPLDAEPKPEDGTEPKPKPEVTAAPKMVVAKATAPRTTRKLGLTAKTDLMDAGFATTIASIGVAGLGGAMWAAKIECDAREGQEEGSCPSPVPQGVRDAGLALMSLGAAGVFVGLSLRWADQRRQRRLRQAPMPSMGPTSVGISWRGQF
jgi:hypothetical protein